jgi:hypothetical protein
MVLFTNEYLMEVGHDAEWLIKENNLSSLSRGIVPVLPSGKKLLLIPLYYLLTRYVRGTTSMRVLLFPPHLCILALYLT